jgi:hypothetical protein
MTQAGRGIGTEMDVGQDVVAWKETESSMGRSWAKVALVTALVLFGGTLLVQEGRKTIDAYRQQLAKPSDLFMAIDWKTMAEQEAEEENLVDELLPSHKPRGGTKPVGMTHRGIQVATLKSLPVEPLAMTVARALSQALQRVETFTSESIGLVTKSINPKSVGRPRPLGV